MRRRIRSARPEWEITPMLTFKRRTFIGTMLSTGLLVAADLAWAYDDPWPDLQEALFPGKAIADGAAFIKITAPERAYDAAVVPIAIDFDPAKMPGIAVKAMTLVIDKNPAPVAAVFHYPDDSANPSIGTRVRVNEYTNIHAVVETTDGRLFMAAVFVKAAGGCSAPASKSVADAQDHLGDLKLKVPKEVAAKTPSKLELLIRHPNFTGMQMDQVTRNYVPADFVQNVTITHEGKPVLSIEGNISLSENPAFDFWLNPKAQGVLRVNAEDSNGRKFERVWMVPAAS
jgi:sulfur-oxidizing protein SoxY